MPAQRRPFGAGLHLRVPESLAHEIPGILAQSDALRFELSLCTPSSWRPSECLSQERDSGVLDETKRFEIEILTKAGPPKARVAKIAEVSVRTVHRVRPEAEALCAAADASGAVTVPQASAPPAAGRAGLPRP